MDSTTTDSMKCDLAYAKRNVLFARMQHIYNLSKNTTTERNRETFLDSVGTMNELRSEFRSTLDEYVALKLKSDPKSLPNYEAINSFEDMYCATKRVLESLSGNSAQHFETAHRQPRLPPIEVLSFDGDVRNWSLFYASFKSIVHQNRSLSDDEKLYYLLGRLSHKAQSVISGITPSGENYSLILQTLVDKFENKRFMAATYIEQILNFKFNGSPSAYNFQMFTDNVTTSVNALRNINIDDLADFILLHLYLKKLDADTVRGFEMYCRDSRVPTFSQLAEYIRTQDRIFQTVGMQSRSPPARPVKPSRPSAPNLQTYAVDASPFNNLKCLCDNITHDFLFKCPKFNKLTPKERFDCTKSRSACINCLNINHNTGKCKSNLKCVCCKRRHHSLLHFENDLVTPPTSSKDGQSPQTQSSLCSVSPFSLASNAEDAGVKSTTVALATAQVVLHDINNRRQLVRCLLDSASQSNFITRECVSRLGFSKIRNSNIVVRGVGGVHKSIQGEVDIKFFSKLNNNVGYDMSALIVDRITGDLPSVPIDIEALPHLKSLSLADDAFATPSSVDMLIGAALFPHLLLPSRTNSNVGSIPPVIETVLGVVVVGSLPTATPAPSTCVNATSCCSVMVNNSVDSLLRRFWELEEVSVSHLEDPVDVECEEHFKATTTRDVSGRYSVALPFRKDSYLLGNSYDVARKRYLCLERKKEASQSLREAYDNVIIDYINKGYLSPVVDNNPEIPSYVLPHHGIYRPGKSTPLRPVLDASCETSSGLSLNDVLHSGPNLQGDLFCIILNFRLFPVALCADVRQMYLQINVHESDRRFQRILYWFSPRDPLQLYEFSRVCFGMKSSPFHALRVVRQLINDDDKEFPIATAIASTSLYMDDIVFSVLTEESAVAGMEELIKLFSRGQFDLVKWACNSGKVLDSIPASHRNFSDVELDKQTHQKILGIHWSMSDDSFRFRVAVPDDRCTKRIILSIVARLWDVMGFVAPTILCAKLLIKELWKLRCDWDDAPAPHVVKLWQRYCRELPCLNGLRIPRHVGVYEGSMVNVVGFADASELAYGAVIYLHITHSDNVKMEMVCAKSKLAPTKTLTVARLELCAVELLSRLLRRVYDTYSSRYDIRDVFAFTDSKVVLCWLNSSPHRWHTFVANRVVKVLDNFPASTFSHVAGIENPADCLSRGLSPSKLIDHPLWFHGPPWASLSPSKWPICKESETAFEDTVLEEKPQQTYTATSHGSSILYELSARMSSWSKLLNVVVFLYRFLGKLPRRASLVITSDDLDFAEKSVIAAVQNHYFSEDILNLQNNKTCSSALMKLSPFLDERILRVGGRLSKADLNYVQMHPAVLPRRDHVVDILIDHYHKKHNHAGPELLMSLLRQRFWILAARRAIRYRIFKCNICFRYNPRPTFPRMADLPSQRVNMAEKAFSHTGCDYAGPIQYTPIRSRGVKCRKAWLCIFTCLTTRAIHIEIATDLSTATFLDAFKRFLSRRGPVQCMYSDQGSNFVGTRSYLHDLYKFLEEHNSQFATELGKDRIDWKLIPPAAPHFGGCWESMVKVVKTHLFKTIGQQILSFEELSTLLTQIEGLLNSRPITHLSSDPSEPSALTPSHFLCSAPLISLPVPETSTVNLRDRHSLLDTLVQSFWKRWRSDYLHQLQTRSKWQNPSVPIKKGTVVVVMTDNAPLFSWPLGVIEEAHVSSDGISRVATVRTTKGTYVRPVVKLCPLPSQ